MLKTMAVMVALAALAACGPTQKDYESAARCKALGHVAGTKEYDQCVYEERMQQMMKEQREEYERAKQQDMDWKLRGRY